MEELFNRRKECPKCIIHTPPSSYYFIPSKKDEYKYLNNNKQNPTKLIRYIFEKKNKSNYKSFENEIYEKFSNYLKSKKIILPMNWKESDTRRFLQSTYFDIEKTLEKIIENIKFEIPKIPFNSYKEILSSRFLYMHGLDINYCPILVTNRKIFMDIIDKYPIENFICAIDTFISYLIEHFFIPGQVENWVMIADLKEVSIWDPPLKLLKIFEFLQTKYIFRLKYLYIYGMETILNFCFNIIKNVIDVRTTNKFKFIDNQNDINNIVLTNIHSSQIERKYGGDANNLIHDLDFPFILPSNEYQIEKNRKEIINEEEYIKKYKNNELCVISPYLYNKNISSETSSKKPIIYNGMEFYEVSSIPSSSRNFTIHDVKSDINYNYNINKEPNYNNKINNSNNSNNNINVVFIENYLKNDDHLIDEKSEGKTGLIDIKNENSGFRELNNYNNINKYKSDNKKLVNHNNKYKLKNNSMNVLVEKEEKNKGCCKDTCKIA